MKLQLPAGRFRAYLFDCDGTIVDSMPLHFLAWTQALGEWSCPFDEELFYAWGGMPVAEIVSALNRRHGLAMPVAAVAERKESLYYELLPQLTAIPEVVEHIHAQHGRIPFAVVTGSNRESAVKSLTTTNLLHRFDTIVAAEDYERSKPAPDAFLIAAERLGIPPAHCLVFEDTEMGLKAAAAAGMSAVRVPMPFERR